MVQNIKLDTLNIKQVNQYLAKADKLRNTGMILTVSGAVLAVAGYVASSIWISSTAIEGWNAFQTLIPMMIGVSVGIPASLTGISLWAIGSTRKKKAELALQRFTLAPEGLMALGLGLTIKF
jgi:hypothetical protein